MKQQNLNLQDLLDRPGVKKAYDRIAPFYRLAEQIILLRKKRKITQVQLAELSETTQAVISRLENATVHCSLETVIRVAEALNAHVELKLVPNEKELEIFEIPVREDCSEQEQGNLNTILFNNSGSGDCVQDTSWQILSQNTNRMKNKHRAPEYA